jgi:chemotaxis protein methyltransferase CheR
MSTAPQDGLRMSDAEYRVFCEFLRGHCGLSFGADARFRVERRLARRVAELQLASFAAYQLRLRGGPNADDELAFVIDELTTNETYFFREMNQLRALVHEILPEVLRQRRPSGASVSLWSAGCSSGEEAYTLVMLALEAGLEPGRDLRVYASDISRAMLRKARRGLYRESSFRDTASALR